MHLNNVEEELRNAENRWLEMVKPIIGLSACVKSIDALHFHGVGERFIRVVSDVLGGIPVIIPAIGAAAVPILSHLDGLIITGSLSMVNPVHYGEYNMLPHAPFDYKRDDTTLQIIRHAINDGIPIFGICRGIQEINVALGGTLHQNLSLLPSTINHLDAGLMQDDTVRFAKKHPVTLTAGGYLSSINPTGCDEIIVNSLHTQAINKLGDGLTIEGKAADGIIEAIRVTSAKSFAIGVQWHPEWEPQKDDFSMALFNNFLVAINEYRQTIKS